MCSGEYRSLSGESEERIRQFQSEGEERESLLLRPLSRQFMLINNEWKYSPIGFYKLAPYKQQKMVICDILKW